ncbi:DUF4386 family protein [Nocardia neocaledoniensis]|uniref:DUF4386 family protein n=1 Tax=Nocardia neocaledoniensis TaxID=236511 RepID=UPI002453AEA5|nr:DUF4386 family protein [Nocardia neocaledoniensis]
MSRKPWTTITLLIAAPVLMNLAFLGLSVSFDYPDVLQTSSTEALARFRAEQGTIVALFTALAAAACAFAPLSILIGRLDSSTTMRWAVRTGVAAALAQAIGLLRWPLLVPGLAEHAAPDRAVLDTFETLNTVLGTVLGETIGYALTATWTVLVVRALRARVPRWFAALGTLSAVAIATGVLVPLGAEPAGLTNFVGYILWSGWLLAFAGLLARYGAELRPTVSQGD